MEILLIWYKIIILNILFRTKPLVSIIGIFDSIKMTLKNSKKINELNVEKINFEKPALILKIRVISIQKEVIIYPW